VIETSGVYAIAVTPFHDDDRIDDASTARMVEFYSGCGVTGLTILGVMGEAHSAPSSATRAACHPASRNRLPHRPRVLLNLANRGSGRMPHTLDRKRKVTRSLDRRQCARTARGFLLRWLFG
jgi:hypothetical protein